MLDFWGVSWISGIDIQKNLMGWKRCLLSMLESYGVRQSQSWQDPLQKSIFCCYIALGQPPMNKSWNSARSVVLQHLALRAVVLAAHATQVLGWIFWRRLASRLSQGGMFSIYKIIFINCNANTRNNKRLKAMLDVSFRINVTLHWPRAASLQGMAEAWRPLTPSYRFLIQDGCDFFTSRGLL